MVTDHHESRPKSQVAEREMCGMTNQKKDKLQYERKQANPVLNGLILFRLLLQFPNSSLVHPTY